MKDIASPTPFINAQIDGSIGWLIFNRPERRNALNTAMWAAIPQLIQQLASETEVRVIVIRGHGGQAFAAGADISEFGETRSDARAARDYEALNGQAFAAIRNCSKPVVAMIEGFCIGGGLAIALAADLRLASPSAVFAIPPARLGLAYPTDSLRDLLAVVSAPVAKEMIFTARRLTADEALRHGLVNAVADNLELEVRRLCDEIAEGAPLTLLHAKRAIAMIGGTSGAPDEAELRKLAAQCFDSADYAEGRSAFAEKRKPRFTGR